MMFSRLSSVLALILTVGLASMVCAQAPVFDYEWISGHPATLTEESAVLRITMSGDLDDPTSPGLVVSGFNIAIEIPEGVVDETLESYVGGGEGFEFIEAMSPIDANAATVASAKVRELADYRTVVDAYPALIHPVAPADGRDELNAMVWEDANFIVEEITSGSVPAGKKWIAVTGVVQRLISKSPIGNIDSMRNAVTDALATAPLGLAGDTTGTVQRAAFLDIKFKVLATPPNIYANKAELFNNIKVFANPLATDFMALDDHLSDPNNTIPTVGPLVAADSTTFENTDGEDGASPPQILVPDPANLSNPSWNLY
jgi:hypothetical protein